MNENKPETKKKAKPGPKPRHGGYVFLRSGLISKENRHIEQYLSAMRSGYIKELGPGEDDLSTGQTVLLNQLVTCIGFTRLVEEKAKKTADLRHLCTRSYMHFMKHGRQLVLDLGINPEAAQSIDAVEYIQSQGGENDKA